MRMVWYSVGKSSVEVNVSRNPKGNIRGIHPKWSNINENMLLYSEITRAHTSSVFKRPTSFVHLILPHHAAFHKIHLPRAIYNFLQLTRIKYPLLPDENMEIIVRGMYTRMTFRTERRAKDDKILGDTGMDNIHSSHSTSGVVKNPFLLEVEVNIRRGVRLGEVGYNMVDHPLCVIWGSCDSWLGYFAEDVEVENIKIFLHDMKKNWRKKIWLEWVTSLLWCYQATRMRRWR